MAGNRQAGGNAVPGRAARAVAAAVLARVVGERASLDSLFAGDGGLPAWRALPANDQALARAIATVALRHRGRIEAAINHLANRRPPQRARHLLDWLHVAAAQILFMDVPDSAAVNLAVGAIADHTASARFAGFANAVLRRMTIERQACLALPVTAATVFPDWLARALVRDHGRDRANAIAAMVGHEPVLDLTPHPRLGSAEIDRLAGELAAIRLATGSLRIVDGPPVRDMPGFAEGSWWVQDTAASLPARLLGDVGGLDIADLCAAPGGKTAQLAAAGARVTAVDISPARLDILRENLARLALDAEIVQADILEWQPERRFDAILLDAPCSATGTLRRHPDIAWNRTPDDVAALVTLQKRLILRALDLLRPGGTLVYANCSILKDEGENLLAGLLRDRQDLAVSPLSPHEVGGDGEWINGQGALRTLPCHLPADPPRQGGMDGFFACRLRRKA